MCSRQALTGCFQLHLGRTGGIVQILQLRTSSSGNAGTRMCPFSESSVIVRILEGSRNGLGSVPFLVPLFTLSERRFSQKMVASRCCCDDYNLSQFLSCFRSQHDRAVQLCNCVENLRSLLDLFPWKNTVTTNTADSCKSFSLSLSQTVTDCGRVHTQVWKRIQTNELAYWALTTQRFTE